MDELFPRVHAASRHSDMTCTSTNNDKLLELNDSISNQQPGEEILRDKAEAEIDHVRGSLASGLQAP
jgi:hypothetical protein